MHFFSRLAHLLFVLTPAWIMMCSNAAAQSDNVDGLELVGTGGEVLRRWTDFIAPGDVSSNPRLLGEVDGKLLFAASDDGTVFDPTLWVIEGDTVAPVPTEGTLTGLLSLPSSAFTRREPVVYQDTAYFVVGTLGRSSK